jgi:hypothetical protein
VKIAQKVPEKEGEALVQSRVRFNRVAENSEIQIKGVQQISEKGWCKAR